VASLAGALAAIAAYLAVVTLDPRFTGPAYGNDVWFEGDLPRIADEMTHRWAAHSRAPVHPLFSLFACAGVYAMRSLHMSPPHAIAALIALGSACWTILLFLVVRAITPSRGEAVLFTAVGATTAAALFWMTVPETYVFGSATMLAALWMLVLAERRTIPESWFVVVSAGTLAVTVTNWVAGLVVTAARWPWRRALQISVNAFVLVVALWSVQRAIIPRADFFVGYSNEQRYLGRAETGGPTRILTVLFAHAIVMPPVETIQKPGRGKVMSVQSAGLADGGALRRVALAAWFALFGVGLYGWLRHFRGSRLLRATVIVAAAEVSLNLLYGTETFLYTLNLVPMLIVMAACGTRTRARGVVSLLALTVLLCGAISNAHALIEGRHFFASTLRPTDIVLSPPAPQPRSLVTASNKANR
jgi:hypothetical protein